MLRGDTRQFLLSEAAKGNALSRRLAAIILLDCARADWNELDFEGLLKTVYHEKGPAVAVEVWAILKQLIEPQAEAARP